MREHVDDRRKPLIVALAVGGPVLVGLTLMLRTARSGALLAQGALVVAVVMIFVAIVVFKDGPVAGLPAPRLAAIATGLIAAAVAGMLYHLYLGRFDRVWGRARGLHPPSISWRRGFSASSSSR